MYGRLAMAVRPEEEDHSSCSFPGAFFIYRGFLPDAGCRAFWGSALLDLFVTELTETTRVSGIGERVE